jgi:hypothetical protein
MKGNIMIYLRKLPKSTSDFKEKIWGWFSTLNFFGANNMIKRFLKPNLT